MKNVLWHWCSVSAIVFSCGVNASESPENPSKPHGVLSKEETRQGVENGRLCTDDKGLGSSLGAVMKHNGKLYRCVRVYGENFTENKKLVWVEVILKNGELTLPDSLR